MKEKEPEGLSKERQVKEARSKRDNKSKELKITTIGKIEISEFFVSF